VEVIEHLKPEELDNLIKALAKNSNKNALYLFNSGNPNFVKKQNPAYLDPLKRGHIISYGIEGLKIMFKKYGFNVFSIPGRDWAFLAEFTDQNHDYSVEKLFTRLWNMNIENKTILQKNDFGYLMFILAIESSRCYLESGRNI